VGKEKDGDKPETVQCGSSLWAIYWLLRAFGIPSKKEKIAQQ